MSGPLTLVLLATWGLTFIGFVVSLLNYIRRYQAVRGSEDLLPTRVAEAPWRFFTSFPTVLHTIRLPHETRQADPELEQKRTAMKRWQWANLGVWALLMLLGIASLFR